MMRSREELEATLKQISNTLYDLGLDTIPDTAEDYSRVQAWRHIELLRLQIADRGKE